MSSHQLWDAKGARRALNRAVANSRAARTLSAQNRLTSEYNRLERMRQEIVRHAKIVAQSDKQEVHDALMQRILRFHQDLGDLEERAQQEGPADQEQAG